MMSKKSWSITADWLQSQVASSAILYVDKTEPGNQVLCWHQQEHRNDPNMRIPANFISEASISTQKSMQQLLRWLQFNLFDKRDLMALLRER